MPPKKKKHYAKFQFSSNPTKAVVSGVNVLHPAVHEKPITKKTSSNWVTMQYKAMLKLN